MAKKYVKTKEGKRTITDARPLTRKAFHALVRKSAQPVKKATESDSASGETSEFQSSDDCNGKNTH